MKNALVLIAIFGSFSLANGQSKNDPTYSVHNYKQPNKAEEAKLIKKEGTDNESYELEKDVNVRNYKVFNTGTQPTGAAVVAVPVETNTNQLVSNGNYKSNFGKNKA